jgi:hypothetical protein
VIKMITLGLNGGIDFPYENEFNFQNEEKLYFVPHHVAHAVSTVDTMFNNSKTRKERIKF